MSEEMENHSGYLSEVAAKLDVKSRGESSDGSGSCRLNC